MPQFTRSRLVIAPIRRDELDFDDYRLASRHHPGFQPLVCGSFSAAFGTVTKRSRHSWQ
jgi:hypothetical protein